MSTWLPGQIERYERVPLVTHRIAVAAAQVEFAAIPGLQSGGETVRAFTEATGAQFPGPCEDDVAANGRRLLQRTNSEGSVLALGLNYLCLDVVRYASRFALFDEFIEVFEALAQAAGHPLTVTSMGLRYVNAITDAHELEQLDTLVQPQMCVVRPGTSEAGRLISDSRNLCLAGPGRSLVNMRCGWPAAVSYPSGVSYGLGKVWTAETDVRMAPEEAAADSGQLRSQFEVLGEVNYDVFRWIFTEEFMALCGKEVAE